MPFPPALQVLFSPVAQVDTLEAVLSPSLPPLPGAVSPVLLVLPQALRTAFCSTAPPSGSALTSASGEPVVQPLTWGTSQAPHGASQVVLVVKKPPTNVGDIRDPGSIPDREDPQEEGMATHSSISWKIPWIEDPGGP